MAKHTLFGKSDDIDPNATGKNIESLKKSETIRRDFFDEFGTIPESILLYNKSERPINLLEGKRYSDTFKDHHDRDDLNDDKHEDLNSHISGSGVSKGALSTFPQNVSFMHSLID